MPELPEVETTLRGIKPLINHRKVVDIIVRHLSLRWPVPQNIHEKITGKTLNHLYRRNKYLLFEFDNGTMILHLGMSGRLCVLNKPVTPKKHDHVDIYFDNNRYLRFTDPRRFGALLWTEQDPNQHPLLAGIGPEPLSKDFGNDYLWKKSQGRKIPVKSFIMDGKVVAGVGNIYATEALFAARIHPQSPAGNVSHAQYKKLTAAIKKVLEKAIEKGGTTLKDFTKSDGTPGYFRIELKAYGHGGEPCPRCHTTLKSTRIGQRGTVYCPHCQNLDV